MKLELKEINPSNEIHEIKEPLIVDNLKTFQDILLCFDKQNIFFKSLEKELIISDSSQILFLFLLFMFLNFSFSFMAMSIKLMSSIFFHKLIKLSKSEFSFSSTIYQMFSFTSVKNKNNAKKVLIYQQEKSKFFNDFFALPIHKEIICKYLHNFYQENEYHLSSDVYSEIDKIKQSIEKESYEDAFNRILQFKSRIDYVNELNKVKI